MWLSKWMFLGMWQQVAVSSKGTDVSWNLEVTHAHTHILHVITESLMVVYRSDFSRPPTYPEIP